MLGNGTELLEQAGIAVIEFNGYVWRDADV